jgi:hypothetical protein
MKASQISSSTLALLLQSQKSTTSTGEEKIPMEARHSYQHAPTPTANSISLEKGKPDSSVYTLPLPQWPYGSGGVVFQRTKEHK